MSMRTNEYFQLPEIECSFIASLSGAKKVTCGKTAGRLHGGEVTLTRIGTPDEVCSIRAAYDVKSVHLCIVPKGVPSVKACTGYTRDKDTAWTKDAAYALRRGQREGIKVIPIDDVFEILCMIFKWCSWAADRHFMTMSAHYTRLVFEHKHTTFLGFYKDDTLLGVSSMEVVDGVGGVCLMKHLPYAWWWAAYMWVETMERADCPIVLCGSQADKFKQSIGLKPRQEYKVADITGKPKLPVTVQDIVGLSKEQKQLIKLAKAQAEKEVKTCVTL